MSFSGATSLVTCPTCKSASVLSRAGIEAGATTKLLVEERRVNGKMYELSYFICPHCGEWVFLQVDDDKSKKVRSRMVKAYLDILSGSKYKRTHALYERTKSDLTIMRKKLEKELEGKSLYDPWTCSEHELKFIDQDCHQLSPL